MAGSGDDDLAHGILLAALTILGVAMIAWGVSGCTSDALPPGCTAADFDTLARNCPTDQCDRLIGEREARCHEAVELE